MFVRGASNYGARFIAYGLAYTSTRMAALPSFPPAVLATRSKIQFPGLIFDESTFNAFDASMEA